MDWIEEADGVFRGGGVKGLGLAGALLGFAEHPTKPVKKWVNVAGASAGAILACYLATGHDAKDMVDLMKETKFGDFQDFPPRRRVHRRRHQPLPQARPRARRGVPQVVRRGAQGRDVRGHEDARRQRLPAEADRRGRDEQDAPRPARRPVALSAPGRDEGDRPGPVRDRQRGADEHVHPVLLRAGAARPRPGDGARTPATPAGSPWDSPTGATWTRRTRPSAAGRRRPIAS